MSQISLHFHFPVTKANIRAGVHHTILNWQQTDGTQSQRHRVCVMHTWFGAVTLCLTSAIIADSVWFFFQTRWIRISCTFISLNSARQRPPGLAYDSCVFSCHILMYPNEKIAELAQNTCKIIVMLWYVRCDWGMFFSVLSKSKWWKPLGKRSINLIMWEDDMGQMFQQ